MGKRLVVRGSYLGSDHVESYSSEESTGIYPVFIGDGWVVIRDKKGDHAWWRVEHITYMSYVGED